MKKIIYVLVDYRGLYRQDISRSRGIQLDTAIKVFEESGYRVIKKTFSEMANSDISEISGCYIFYTSSESLEYKEYIKGIVYELGKNNVLLPDFDMLMCHEDKCYQELLKKRKKIESLHAECFGCVKELEEKKESFQYPVVMKQYSGAGSISVFKAETSKQLIKIAKKMNRNKEFYEYYAKFWYKKLKGKLDSEYQYDDSHLGRLVVQEFVPNLENDWKVLVFGKKVYCLYRGIRENDFRASGSGKFKYETPPVEILDFAYDVFERMNVPFLSLDLCMDKDKKVYLIEFQGVHFGPYTLINSEQYYVKEDTWVTKEGKSDLAKEYAAAVIEYIEKMAESE